MIDDASEDVNENTDGGDESKTRKNEVRCESIPREFCGFHVRGY